MYAPALKACMQELQARKVEVEEAVSSAANPPPLRIHPNLAKLYERKVRELEKGLNDDSIKAEASELLRSLIERVVSTPATDALDGIEAELHGDLAAIIAITQDSGLFFKTSFRWFFGTSKPVLGRSRNSAR
jgi:hypothetical protein